MLEVLEGDRLRIKILFWCWILIFLKHSSGICGAV